MNSARPQFKVPVRKAEKVGPEYNLWYWNPNRAGVRTAPAWFMEKLEEFDRDDDLAVTWNPITERWQLWARSPRLVHPICQGWKLLFVHKGPSGEYLPLDERVFARLYWASARAFGSAKSYFERIASELQRDREKRDNQIKQDQIDQAMPFFDHSQIKVSMFGPSSGSKFSTYHA